MFDPNELKEKAFKKNLGGSYNAAEVDDFLAQLTDDYTKIYTDNAELQVKLELMAQRLAGYKSEEQKIKTAVANVKLLCDSLIAEANEKSKTIVETAIAERDSIISSLEETIRQKRSEIEQINASVAEYKENMLFKYKLHYDSINSLPLFDILSDEQLIEKAQQRLAALKEKEQDIPVLLDEKQDKQEGEVAEFIEPTEKPAAPALKQQQQEIKAKVIHRISEHRETAVFDKIGISNPQPTGEPTVVFDKPVTLQQASQEEEIPEGQTNFEELEEVLKSKPEETSEEPPLVKAAAAANQKAYDEDVFASFAPKAELKTEEAPIAAQEDEQPKTEAPADDKDDIDAPDFLKNRRRRRSTASAEDKQSLIDSIKTALAEKEEQERLRLLQEDEKQREMEDIGASAHPIDDEEEEEEIVSDFKNDIRFGKDYEEEDDDDEDDDDDDDGFFSFFRSK